MDRFKIGHKISKNGIKKQDTIKCIRPNFNKYVSHSIQHAKLYYYPTNQQLYAKNGSNLASQS